MLQQIITRVLVAYPGQAIWQMASVSRSIVPERKQVCNAILGTVYCQLTTKQDIREQIKETLDLCDNLIDLCMAKIPDRVQKLSLKNHFPKVYSQMRQHYNVVMPCQHTLWPSIPESSATMASHQPYGSNLLRIDRKYTFRGTTDLGPSRHLNRRC